MCTNNEMQDKIKELKELRLMKEEIEAEINALEDGIKAVMGAEEILISGPFKVTWKTVQSSRVDTTALKKALPDVAAQFTKTTVSRRFVVA